MDGDLMRYVVISGHSMIFDLADGSLSTEPIAICMRGKEERRIFSAEAFLNAVERISKTSSPCIVFGIDVKEKDIRPITE